MHLIAQRELAIILRTKWPRYDFGPSENGETTKNERSSPAERQPRNRRRTDDRVTAFRRTPRLYFATRPPGTPRRAIGVRVCACWHTETILGAPVPAQEVISPVLGTREYLEYGAQASRSTPWALPQPLNCELRTKLMGRKETLAASGLLVYGGSTQWVRGAKWIECKAKSYWSLSTLYSLCKGRLIIW